MVGMDFTQLINQALERGDLVAVVVIFIVTGAGLYLKQKPGGKAEADRSKAVSDPVLKLEKVAVRLDALDTRIARVENDLEHIPTIKQFHDLEVKFERMSGRMMGIERTTESTGRAVGRIEDFMLKMKRD